MGKLQQGYTLRINDRLNLTGHLWGDRFFSCPMDDEYFNYTMRYVECNSTSAKLVRQPWDYLWSSALAHITGQDPLGILALDKWLVRYPLEVWKELLEQQLEYKEIEHIRRQTLSGQWLRAPTSR